MTDIQRPRLIRHVAAATWLVLALAGTAVATEPLVGPREITIIAHRGDLAAAPENSLAAIRAAMTSGADGVEFDVIRSTDGTWWLLHDETLDARTTGTGRIDASPDAMLETLRLDAGLGYDQARDTDVPLARLDDVLSLMRDYDGLVIVDCKDRSEDGHAALARYLLARDMVTDVIARDLAGASAIKAVDRRFKVYTLGDTNWHPDVDVWLAWSERDVHPPLTVWADLWGELAMFVEQGYHGRSERPLLDNGRRWGVSLVITNDVAGALAWRTDIESLGQ